MYNKLFTKILDSSVWLEDSDTRIVWITLLASMDEDGFCQFAAIGNLANRAMVPVGKAAAAMAKLEGPDPCSSDPSNGGCRVERVPGGWLVLNATKYREIVKRVEQKRLTRERVQRHRDKCNSDVTLCNASVTQSEAYTEAEAVVSSYEETTPYSPPLGDAVDLELTSPEPKSKPKPKKARKKADDAELEIKSYRARVDDVAGTIQDLWPSKRQNGSPISFSTPALLQRLDEILTGYPSLDADKLVEIAKSYLADGCWHAPQYFFGKGKNGAVPPWIEHARFLNHIHGGAK